MKLTHNSVLPSTRFTTYLVCDLAQQVSLHTFNLHYIYHDKWLNKFYRELLGHSMSEYNLSLHANGTRYVFISRLKPWAFPRSTYCKNATMKQTKGSKECISNPFDMVFRTMTERMPGEQPNNVYQKRKQFRSDLIILLRNIERRHC